MTDIERIHEIEKILSVKLHRVETLEALDTKNAFKIVFFFQGTRNYCLDNDGNVIGLSLDNSSVHLLPASIWNDFKHIQKLSLKDNKLTDISALKDLKGLTTLDLSYNKQLTDISVLKDLKGLNTLNLSNNKIADISALKDLKGLNTLNLSNNKIVDISALKDLKGLTTLDLSGNELTDINVLKELQGLTELLLRHNQLTDISVLKDLIELTKLNVT